MTVERIDPYEPPKASLDTIDDRGQDAPALWNPNTASIWSIVLTPAFGAFIHARNWDVMGEARHATIQRGWAWFYIAVLCGTALLAFISSDVRETRIRFNVVDFLYLVAWYFFGARSQIEQVREAYGQSYPRRSWLRPVLITVGIVVGAFMCVYGATFAVNTTR